MRCNFSVDLSENLLAGRISSLRAASAFGDFLFDPDRYIMSQDDGEDGENNDGSVILRDLERR
jgi:hypothetical protein